MNLSQSISKNMSVQIVGKALSVLIGLAIVAILTRSLGAHAFGEYTTAVTFLQLFGVIVDFGLTLTLVVMISEYGADEENLVGNILGLRLFSAMILFTMAPIAVLAFPWSETIKLGVLIGAVAFFFMSGASMLSGVFQKHAVMWRATLAEFINRIVLLSLVAAFAFLNLGVLWMIAAMIVTNIVWLFLTIRLARPYVKIRPKSDWKIWKKTWTRSWPIALSIIFNLLYLKGDILFLAYYREQTEVGLYGVAYKVVDVLTALPIMYMGLLLPILTKDWTSGKRPEFRHHITSAFDIFMISIIPIIIGTQAVAEPLAVLFAGQGYDASGTVLRWLIIAVLGVFIGTLYGHVVVALNKQKQMIWGYALVAIFSIIGYLLFIPPYGMFGAAYVTIFSELAIALITLIVVFKTSGAKPNLTKTGKALLSSLLMYNILVLLPAWPVLILVAFGAIIYIIAMLALKALTINELRAVIPHR